MPNSQLEAVEKMLHDHQIELIDLKCLDLNGRLHHISLPVNPGILARLVREGVRFDGSSYGYSKVEDSDLILVPDLDTALIDPFREASTLSFFAHIHLTDADRTPFSQDSRALAREAESYLAKHTDADQSWWGPEFEFYLFSDVDYATSTSSSYYSVGSEERFNRAYHAANPFDLYDDFRDEACRTFRQQGIEVKYHHHEVGERGQQEIETYFKPLLASADNIVKAKYILFNMARLKDLHITFMPKPMYRQAGNGLHLHTFLTKAGRNAFHDPDQYANFNDLGRFFIGGVLTHGRALAAFTNPSTNSYKRLVPGFEAPCALTFGRGDRTSAVRIPNYVSNPEQTRFEYRPPDATCNPYLCLSAILLAGIDGIQKRIDPTQAGFGPSEGMDETTERFHLPRILDEALDALDRDRDFLKAGDIFRDDLIDQWIRIKQDEIRAIATMPHPYEYQLYFTL